MGLRRTMMAAASSGGGGSDPYWANVTSLLHFDGTDGSTTFTDERARVWTPTATAKISTARSMFGGASGLFDGAGYITTPYVAADFDWWTSDFTIECWIYIDNTTWGYTSGSFNLPNMVGNMNPTDADNSWSFGPIGGNKLSFFYWAGTQRQIISSDVIPAATWTHVAMTKAADGIRLFVSGRALAPVAILGTPINSGSPLTIGHVWITTGIVGNLDGLRITKGVARYTTDFSPPTAPFPNS